MAQHVGIFRIWAGEHEVNFSAPPRPPPSARGSFSGFRRVIACLTSTRGCLSLSSLVSPPPVLLKVPLPPVDASANKTPTRSYALGTEFPRKQFLRFLFSHGFFFCGVYIFLHIEIKTLKSYKCQKNSGSANGTSSSNTSYTTPMISSKLMLVKRNHLTSILVIIMQRWRGTGRH